MISLYSQLTGGVVELKETNFERGITADNKRNYDFKVFKHDAGGTTQSIERGKTTLKPYHALLQELEVELSSSGYLLDLSSPSCRHYNCKNCVQVFNSREEAINSGYRPCGNCKP